MTAIEASETALIESKMAELGRNCGAAQAAISTVLAEKGAEYAEQVKRRISDLQLAIEASPVDAEKKEEIKATITQAFEDDF